MWRRDRRLSKRAWAGILGVSLIGGGLFVLGDFAFERWSLQANQNGVSMSTQPVDPLLPFHMPGIDRPKVVEAVHSTLRPEEEVLGFVLNGKARAYRLDAFRDRSKHVVNDVIGEVPITVAFCDLNNCVSAYTGRSGEGPLRISVAGLYEGREMLLKVENTIYFQESGRSVSSGDSRVTLPLPRIEPTRTTWERWKNEHPETEVFEGVR